MRMKMAVTLLIYPTRVALATIILRELKYLFSSPKAERPVKYVMYEYLNSW